MERNSELNSLEFTTTRLKISNVESYLELESSRSELLSSIVDLLSPAVVNCLPANFHGIDTTQLAEVWLNKMLSDSSLLAIKLKNPTSLIGFVFLNETDHASVHLGYLLGESYWNRGLASELLLGLIETCRVERHAEKLIAGVDKNNLASIKLLEKTGFTAHESTKSGVSFFEYSLHNL